MKKSIKILIAALVSFGLLAGSFFPAMAYADDNNCVPTAILGDGTEVCEDGTGSSVIDVLKFVLDILMAGVGVFGVIGVVVVGIQYMTAGGNEAQLTKAKRRLLEIVIGVALFAAMYGILKWLGVDASRATSFRTEDLTEIVA